MVIKSKNLVKDKPWIKIISLLFTFLSLSIFLEVITFILRDFYYFRQLFYNWYRIQTRIFILFGPDIYMNSRLFAICFIALGMGSLVLAYFCFRIHKINRTTETVFDKVIQILYKKLPFEILLISSSLSIVASIYVSIVTVYSSYYRYVYFFDKFIFLDALALSLIYFLFRYIKYNREHLLDKFFIIKSMKTIFNIFGIKSITKKIAIVLLIQIISIPINYYIIMFICYYLDYSPKIYFIIQFLIMTICSVYIYRQISSKFNYIEYISKEINNLKEGCLDYKLEIRGTDQLSTLAKNINNMSAGLKKAVNNAIKSEKMKTELITNVSHDLKTPLTSIINYVDMLKSPNIDENTRNDYLAILDKKSKRLKTLVEEIFEASKLSSGEIEFNFEKTDIKELLVQSIVEMEDKIQESKLDFIIDTPEQPIYAMIDGKRTWRAFENLITNILKYSTPNTRVYIDLSLEKDDIFITFKNISSYRLNLKPEEFLERFRRGDSSRNTEGSGLGLSITQSIIDNQNGNMDLQIDGDLFKVILSFKSL